jgi:hypothetical protein
LNKFDTSQLGFNQELLQEQWGIEGEGVEFNVVLFFIIQGDFNWMVISHNKCWSNLFQNILTLMIIVTFGPCDAAVFLDINTITVEFIRQLT